VSALLVLLVLAAPPGERVDFGTTAARRVRLLRHENAGVRRQAALLLAHAPPDQAIAGLIVALRDPVAAVREAVAATLQQLGDERAVPFLARRCRVEASPRVLRRLLVALARCGGSYVARHIVPFLEHPDRTVRVAAAAALGHVGDAGQRDALWAALRFAPDDPGFAVRSAVLSAFVNLGWTDDVRQAIKELEEMGARRHWMSRTAVLAAIGAAGLEERAPQLRREVRTSEDPRVVAAAAAGLARLGHADEVRGLVRHPSPRVRRAALAALQQAGDPQAVPLAKQVVETDRDVQVRFEAVLVLHHANDPAADMYLVDALKSRNPLFWITALGALERKHGRSFGRDPAAWAEFLAKARKRGD
jgi:HEAT repeat protein